jgi:hypothetical protein
MTLNDGDYCSLGKKKTGLHGTPLAPIVPHHMPLMPPTAFDFIPIRQLVSPAG